MNGICASLERQRMLGHPTYLLGFKAMEGQLPDDSSWAFLSCIDHLILLHHRGSTWQGIQVRYVLTTSPVLRGGSHSNSACESYPGWNFSLPDVGWKAPAAVSTPLATRGQDESWVLPWAQTQAHPQEVSWLRWVGVLSQGFTQRFVSDWQFEEPSCRCLCVGLVFRDHCSYWMSVGYSEYLDSVWDSSHDWNSYEHWKIWA